MILEKKKTKKTAMLQDVWTSLKLAEKTLKNLFGYRAGGDIANTALVPAAASQNNPGSSGSASTKLVRAEPHPLSGSRS